MAKYVVYFQAFAQTHIEVEATDATEARSKAEAEVAPPTVSYRCTGIYEVNDRGETIHETLVF